VVTEKYQITFDALPEFVLLFPKKNYLFAAKFSCNMINSRPRKCLGFKTPNQLFLGSGFIIKI
jgi:hypothetical protein